MAKKETQGMKAVRAIGTGCGVTNPNTVRRLLKKVLNAAPVLRGKDHKAVLVDFLSNVDHIGGELSDKQLVTKLRDTIAGTDSEQLRYAINDVYGKRGIPPLS